MSKTKDRILEALKVVQDPDLHQDIVSLGFVKDLAYCDGLAKFTLELTTPACPVKDQLKEQARQAALTVDEVETVNIEMTAQVRDSLPAGNQVGGQVKQVIAVTSGKGGVGKSTCTVNLAAALAATGAKVGILDADVYGPSLPTMLGVDKGPEVTADKKIHPVEHRGLQVISMGLLMSPDQPVIWRGPLVFSAIRQFLKDVQWDGLDYLVVDMPPGTGDAQLTLVQQVPLSGVVMVTTPQEVALADVRRGIRMFREVDVPVLGVVENMSFFVCPESGKAYDIFGKGGGGRVAKEYGLPLLAEIPIDPAIREGGDTGRPAVEHEGSRVRDAFLALADKVDELAVEPA